MKHILLFAAGVCSIAFTYAQTTVKGIVVDATTNSPLSGATITFAGKGGTSSNDAGQFSIECGTTHKITVSYLGYEAVQKTIKNCNDELRIALILKSRALNEVEITATSNQNKSILYQPASITKLNTTELKRGTGLYLDDAINANVPGVTMSRRTTSAGQQLNIRGYGNGVRGTNGVSSNFDVQGTKIYLNGIPVTDAEGITVLDDIDFGSVGNVEVVKGPSGTLYGLAIAGVVNLKTTKPEWGKTSFGQDVLLGSYGLQRFTTHFETAGEHSSLLVNYGYQHSDGFIVHTASSKRFVNLSGDFQINNKQSLTTYFGYSNSYEERQGELTIGQYDTLNWSGNPEYIKRNAHSNVISFRGGVGHTYTFNNHMSNTTTVFGSGVTNNSSSAAGWTDKNPINFGLRSTFNTQFGLSNGSTLNGITGVETQHQFAQTIGYNMASNPANPSGYWIIDTMRSNQFTYTANTSVFTEWTLALPSDLSVTAGLGYSTMHIELQDRYRPRNNTKPNASYATDYNNLFSPHIAINKVFNKYFSAYASYSRGYKAPVSSYFFIPATGQLNTGLKPEIGDQYEIGSKGTLLNYKLMYQVALFDAVFSDKMTAVAVPLNPPAVGTAYSYVANGGKQNDKGIEASLKYTVYESSKGVFSLIRPFANLTYSDFKYEDYSFQRLKPGSGNAKVDTLSYDGRAVAGVARYVANVGFDLTTNPGLYANMVYSYKDGMPITSDNLYKTTSYNLLNAKLGFRRSISHFDVDAFVGANNITGTKYYFMVFVNQLPDAYLPAPKEINYFGGINVKYNF
jgi:iron complex outermembrane receptor protein